jgi:hypothetical protein
LKYLFSKLKSKKTLWIIAYRQIPSRTEVDLIECK